MLIIDIGSFFDVKSSKKRVLSSEQSETGDKQKKQKKKQREGSRNESTTSTLGDIFCQRFEES